MCRFLIYLLAILNITVGFYLLYKRAGRFGLLTYKIFLEEKTSHTEDEKDNKKDNNH